MQLLIGYDFLGLCCFYYDEPSHLIDDKHLLKDSEKCGHGMEIHSSLLLDALLQ